MVTTTYFSFTFLPSPAQGHGSVTTSSISKLSKFPYDQRAWTERFCQRRTFLWDSVKLPQLGCPKTLVAPSNQRSYLCQNTFFFFWLSEEWRGPVLNSWLTVRLPNSPSWTRCEQKWTWQWRRERLPWFLGGAEARGDMFIAVAVQNVYSFTFFN